MGSMKRILVVENEDNYLKAAGKYFRRNKGVEFVNYAPDLFMAMMNLTQDDHPDGVISDCLFPYETGSSSINMGCQTINKMMAADPDEIEVRKHLDKLSKYVEMDDDLRSKMRRLALSEGDNFLETTIVRGIVQMSMKMEMDAVKQFAINSLSACPPKYRDHYEILRNIMKGDSGYQPLGVLVGDRAEELGIPFVLAQSPGEIDWPVTKYATLKGWKTLPGDRKGKPVFWEIAFNALKEVAAETAE